MFQTTLNDFHVSYQINAYTRQANRMAGIHSQLNTNIQEAFQRAGLEIMSPTCLAQRDGNTVALPQENAQRITVRRRSAWRLRRNLERMTRRNLLSIAIATAAKGAQKKPVTGSGEHTYEVTHDWATLPSHIQFGNTHGVAVDAQGRVIIAHTVHKSSQSGDAIAVFDNTGKFVKSWGADMRGGAHGLLVRKEGSEEFLYHCDNVKGFVRKTTLDGEVVWIMHCPFMCGHYRKAGEYRPSNLAIAPNGDIYVADGYGKFYIHHFDAKTRWVRTFGGSRDLMNRNPNAETAPGTTIWPHAIAIDERGPEPLLMVGERGANSRIQYFRLNGEPLHSVKDGVRWPSTFEFRNGLLLMPDLKAVVTLFDRNNKPVAQLGDGRQPDGKTYEGIRTQGRETFAEGKFIAPHAACFDHEGNIYVVEWVEVGRVTKLRKVG